MDESTCSPDVQRGKECPFAVWGVCRAPLVVTIIPIFQVTGLIRCARVPLHPSPFPPAFFPCAQTLAMTLAFVREYVCEGNIVCPCGK